MIERRLFMLATASALSAVPASTMASERKIAVTSADTLSDAERQRHERYMQMAIDTLESGPPFGAVIVDHDKDEVMCVGKNAGGSNRIYHGEMVAMINCSTEHPNID